MANFIKGSSQDELDQLFKAIHKLDVSERMITPSALSQARGKLSHEVFIDLQDAVCAFVNEKAPLVTYHGMRVFAIDGSTIIFPNTSENREHYATEHCTGWGREKMGREDWIGVLLGKH